MKEKAKRHKKSSKTEKTDQDPDFPSNPGLMNFPHTIGSAVIKPEDLGKSKGRAITAMREQTRMQMTQLYEQMHLLAEQAKEIQKRIEVSEKIYMAQIGFEPIIGQVYYLYKKDEETNINILSMISPSEWGKKNPYVKFISSVKLLADHTWEILNSSRET